MRLLISDRASRVCVCAIYTELFSTFVAALKAEAHYKYRRRITEHKMIIIIR